MVTVYTPNSQSELRRLEYRMQWEKDFLSYLLNLQEKKPVIVCGDLMWRIKTLTLKIRKQTEIIRDLQMRREPAFLRVMESGFIDTFRYFYTELEGAYSWWSYRFKAREKNAGWRIDYFLFLLSLASKLDDAKIHSEIMGSDHCPIELTINI